MKLTSLKDIVDEYKNITILSHINPDADAIGTSLGIYSILKKYGKRVEVVNYSTDLPKHLDFLPNFSKIKHKIDYKESLIISCDCGSVDRLGFDLSDRVIVNIDHHQSNQNYGKYNFVDPLLSSSSQVAYGVMEGKFPVCSDAATCFYTAMLSDTRYFTTNNVNEDVFAFAIELLERGAEYGEVAFNLTQRRSLASLRVLGRILETLTLYFDATVASLIADQEMIDATGAKMSDMDGVVDYARSLATVEIGIFLVQDGAKVRVSLRSKKTNIIPIAEYFGGGGHINACGFTVESGNIEEILDKILDQIKILINKQ